MHVAAVTEAGSKIAYYSLTSILLGVHYVNWKRQLSPDEILTHLKKVGLANFCCP